MEHKDTNGETGKVLYRSEPDAKERFFEIHREDGISSKEEVRERLAGYVNIVRKIYERIQYEKNETSE